MEGGSDGAGDKRERDEEKSSQGSDSPPPPPDNAKQPPPKRAKFDLVSTNESAQPNAPATRAANAATAARPHACSVPGCPWGPFKNRTALNAHIRSNHEELAPTADTRYPCPVDGCEVAPYKWKGTLDAHMRDVHEASIPDAVDDTRVSCPVPGCPAKTFLNNDSLGSHRRRKHPDWVDPNARVVPDKVKLLCPVPECGKPYAGRNSLSSHLGKAHPGWVKAKIATDTYQCPVPDCVERPFSDKYSLNSHMGNEHEGWAEPGPAVGPDAAVDPVAAVKKYPCPSPGCKLGPFSYKKGLDEHIRERHEGVASSTYDHTCDDCGTHQEASEWEDSLCDDCLERHQAFEREGLPLPPRLHNSTIRPTDPPPSFASLKQLAVTSFRESRPGYSAGQFDSEPGAQPKASRHDYWSWKHADILDELRQRGIPTTGSGGIWLSRIAPGVGVLQVEDARRGLLPRPQQQGASKYHYMLTDELKKLARKRGAKVKETETWQGALTYLLLNEDTAAAYAEEMSEEDQALINEIMDNDLAEQAIDPALLNLAPVDPARAPSNRRPFRTTHNRGINGSEEALDSLNDTITNGWLPAPTSARGLLCGPNALVMTLTARRDLWRQQNPGMYPFRRHIEASDMMALLFTNYQPGEFAPPNTLGNLTPAYEAYIERTIGWEVREDYGAYFLHYDMFRRMDNLSLEQLDAIVELLYEAGSIEEHYGLGVVTGSHTRRNRLGAEVDVPANARIHRASPNGEPILWVYNDPALGANEYAHWEGMNELGRQDRALEWGMRIPIADTIAPSRLPMAKRDSGGGPIETRVQRLKREMDNARDNYTAYLRAARKMCKPCRRKDLSPALCNGRPGDTKCDNCKPGECEWDDHVIDFPTIHFGIGNLTMDDIVDWDREISPLEREKLVKQTLEMYLEEEPDDLHFLVIYTARMSSHQGWAAFMQILQDLITTGTHYNNHLNGPNHNNVPEGQRPGGQNANIPMRSYYQVIARHGTRRVPYRLGNLNDPYLITMVNLLHHVLRAGNLNLPIEIQFVTMGIAGFSVDITGWGDRNRGFFRWVLDQDAANGTNVADRIYIVAVVEPAVVDGIAAFSLHHPNPSPDYVGWRNKYLIKNKLADLIDRWRICAPIWQANYTNALWNAANPDAVPQLPMFPLPFNPFGAKLDSFLEAMWWEAAWRSGGTDGTTSPTAAQVAARNVARNAGA